MVSDRQVRRLLSLLIKGEKYGVAAAKAGMDAKTARKYRRAGRLPSELRQPRTWRTRKDPFAEVWDEVRGLLEGDEGLEATALFEHLQRKYPGHFADGQLRTLQRRVKHWRATEGPCKEVYFAQEHRPAELCASDFTDMRELGITIGGQVFEHLVYHFVLTYSNWETGTVCFSESFESLSEGLQRALWELGGVPHAHRTDRLSTAVQKTGHPDEFTQRYTGLLAHYGLEGRKTQAGHPHENGDVEQRHHRLKRSLDQSLRLRGSRDFETREAYEAFLAAELGRRNAGRRERLEEERKALSPLPGSRLDSVTRLRARVTAGSTIYVQKNIYSVPSRLIGEMVDVRLWAERVEVWLGNQRVETLPRLRGEKKHRVRYHHVIDSLVRKPGAFENYRYREDLYPTSWFRIAYDSLRRCHEPGRANREYLRILKTASDEGESLVEDALRWLLERGEALTSSAVQALVESGRGLPPATAIEIDTVDLGLYDALLVGGEEAEPCPRPLTPQFA